MSLIRVTRSSRWSAVVWIAAALYAVILTFESVRDYNAFRASFDLAQYDQLFWLLARWEEPFSTIITRPMMAGHFEPAAILMTSVYWLGLDVPGLLAAQSIGLALTAPALYALARTGGASPALASIPALVWLVCPWVAAVNLFDFHPVAFVPVLLVLSVYAAVQDRLFLLFLTTFLALGLKEDVAATYVVLGVVLAIHGKRRLGAVLAVVALTWLTAAYLVLQSYGPSYGTYGRRFAGPRGDSVADTARWILTHPLETLSDVVQQSALGVGVLVASTLCLALLAPSWILLSVPTALHNALSAYAPQHDLEFHYHLGTMTGLFIAAAMGVSRLTEITAPKRRLLSAAAAAFVAVTIAGTILVHDPMRPVLRTDLVNVRAALGRIPDDASVSATVSLQPLLSQRHEIYSLPEPFVPVDWGSTLTSEEFAERAARVRFVAYRDGDTLPTGGVEPRRNLDTVLPLLDQLGFVEIARGGPVHLLERRSALR